MCPRCGIQSSWASKRNLLLCADCGYQASVTAGTIFQDTRKPLTLWFRAAWWVTTQKGGASALELQRVLGLGSYVTAWTWLHKFRRAMVRPGRNRLVGRVEVDETYVGGVEEGVRGREMVGKALVAVAAEEDGRGMGRIRLRRIVDASAASLEAFVEEAIQPGSLVHTDGWEGYAGLENKGYRHEVTVLRGKRQSASKLLPRVHRVASLLAVGTHVLMGFGGREAPTSSCGGRSSSTSTCPLDTRVLPGHHRALEGICSLAPNPSVSGRRQEGARGPKDGSNGLGERFGSRAAASRRCLPLRHPQTESSRLQWQLAPGVN